MGRAATIFKELLHRLEQGRRCTILFFGYEGATRVTWRRHGVTAATKIHNDGQQRRDSKNKRECGSERIFYFSPTRHGMAAAPQ